MTIKQDKQRHDNVRYERQKLAENCKYCRTGSPHIQCPACGKVCTGCIKTNHFRVVCRSMQRQQQSKRLLKSRILVHMIQYDEYSHSLERDQHDRGFDSVNMKYLNCDTVKSVIFIRSQALVKKGVHSIPSRHLK